MHLKSSLKQDVLIEGVTKCTKQASRFPVPCIPHPSSVSNFFDNIFLDKSSLLVLILDPGSCFFHSVAAVETTLLKTIILLPGLSSALFNCGNFYYIDLRYLVTTSEYAVGHLKGHDFATWMCVSHMVGHRRKQVLEMGLFCCLLAGR